MTPPAWMKYMMLSATVDSGSKKFNEGGRGAESCRVSNFRTEVFRRPHTRLARNTNDSPAGD